MDKKAKRAYDKAMNYYEKGKIEKALEVCEEILAEGLDCPNVLNFKGLLLYQKGNLNEAVTVWRINRDLNNNDIAQNYIKDAVDDEKRLELYKQGEQALRQLKIDRALELFKRCAESDFNSIKVNTGIAMCYQKKGDFYRAKEYVDKALSIDQSAVTAKIIEKELRENGIYLKSNQSSKGFLVVITTLIVITAIAAGGYTIMSKVKHSNQNNVEEAKNIENTETNDASDKGVEAESNENLETTFKETTDDTKKVDFDKQKVKVLIANNDFNGIYEQLKNVKENSIAKEDLDVYKQALALMKDQGISKFYEDGLARFNQSNYAEAKSSLDKAYAYCEGSSIKEHILFYRASNSYKLSDKTKAIPQFEEYYKQYPKGVYTQEALYELALLTNSTDKEESKTYANTLIKNYPGSIYINDNIIGISKS